MAHRKGRSVLTGTGIVLGVAIFFGVLVSNATTQAGVDRLIEDFTGRADVVASASGAFNARLPASTLNQLKALPDVEFAVGGLGFGTTAPDKKTDDEDAAFFVRGIDLEAERRIMDYELEGGRFFRPGLPEVIAAPEVAERLKLHLGTRLVITTPKGRKTVTVTGILTKTGAGREADRAYTSLPVARTYVGEGSVFGGISMILRQGTNVEKWIDRHEEAIDGVRLQDTDTLAQGFKSFLEVFGTFLTFFAVITLFVGAFLIYLTLSMAIIERTRMYGTLRALGATRRQVRRIVIAEAVVLGLVSTVLGLALGLLLAKGLLALISSLFDLDLPGLSVAPAAVISALIVGLFVTLAASLIPAMRAGRLAPVEAMKGDYAGETRLGRAWIVGAVIFVVSLGLAIGTSNTPENASALSPIGVIGILLGSILLVPILLRPLASVLGKITNRLARGVGDIAVLHLAKERSRSAYTLALIMIVMAMLFATGGLYLSVRAGVDELIDRQFGADLFIQGQAPLDPALEAKLRDRPDIDKVSPMRFGFTRATKPKSDEHEDVFLAMIDPTSYFDLSSFFWKDGSDDVAKAAMLRGRSVLIPVQLTKRLEVGRGDQIILDTSKGKVPFTIAGVYRDGPGPPGMTVGLPDARTYLRAGKPLGFIASVPEGSDAAKVKTALEETIGKDVGLSVDTTADNKEQAASQIGQYFRIIYAILLVAAIVGLLGLANTLAMSVLRRFREIGILRAIGVTRSQMWRMVLVESTTLGLVAFVLSIPLGWLMTFIVVRSTSEGFGFDVPTVYPWTWIPIVAAFGLAVAGIAAIAPGRRASRLEVVTALQYE